MKRFLPLFLLTVLLAGCNSTQKKQKAWIYETLPGYVWIDITYDALENDFDQRTDKYIAWANQAVEEYSDNGDMEDLNNLLTADLWGLSDLYLLGGGSSKAEKKRAAVINNYKEHFETVSNTLAEETEKCYSYRDSSYNTTTHITDEDIFTSLFGTPENIPQVDFTVIHNVAVWIAVNIFQNMERPVISSCEFDKDKNLWVVRLDNAETQYVKFYKRDDGEYDVEYGAKLKKDGTPESEDTYITNFTGKKSSIAKKEPTVSSDSFEKCPNPTMDMLYGVWHSYNSGDEFVEVTITKDGVERGNDINYYESIGSTAYKQWGKRFENGVVYSGTIEELSIQDDGRIYICDPNPELGYVYYSFYLDKSKSFMVDEYTQKIIFKKIK